MSKRNLAIVGGLLVVLAIVLALWLRGETPTEEAADEGPDATEARRALVEKKLAARQGRELELSEPQILRGRVQRETDDQGVPGAVVLLTRKSMTQGASTEPGAPPVPLHVVTDDAGEFELPNVAPGRYVISATARGYLPGQRNDVHVVPSKADQRVTLSLREGGHALHGTITDIGGGPIEGVLVQVNDVESGNLFGVRFAPPAGLSDEEGRYEIPLPNGSYVLTTYHPDYVATFRMTQIVDGPRVEDLQLTPGATIEGIVRQRGTDQPVADAIVTFQDGRNGQTGGFRINIGADGRMVRTGEDGRFRLEGVNPGVAQVEAHAAHGASRESVSVPVGVGESVTGVELILDAAYTISGFVVPSDDPEGAVEGVMVGAYSVSPPSLTVAVSPTDADGYFEIRGMLPGSYTVGAIGEDLLPNISGAAATITDADVTDVLVKMEVGYRIRGRVEPGMAAKLGLTIDMEQMSLGKIFDAIAVAFAHATADDEGNFDLGPVRDGEYTLVADGPDGHHGELPVKVEGADLEGVVVSMQPRASIAGMVVDATGAPQEGLTVQASTVGGGSERFSMMMRGPFGQGGTPTAPDGTFVVRGLEAGEVSVVVRDGKGRVVPWADDGDAVEPSSMVMTIAEGEQKTDVVLRVQSRSGVLSGTVVDASGAPVPDAWVTASLEISAEQFGTMMTGPKVRDPKEPERIRGVTPPDDDDDDFEMPGFFAEQPVLTDELGRFTVTRLRSGQRYSIVAEGDKGGARGRVEDLVPDQSAVVIRLEAVAGISGVVTASGKPVERYTLKLSGPSQRSKSVFDEDGKFKLERIDAGQYTLSVRSDEGVAHEEEIEVRADETTEVTIELQDYGKLTGKLVDTATGEPIAGVVALVQPEGGDPDPSQALAMLTGGGTRTGRDGTFEVGKVSPGKGMLVFLDTAAAMSGGGFVAGADYEIDAGQTVDLGTINGMPASTVEPDERGKYGLGLTVKPVAKRPRPPGTKLEDEEPDAAGEDPTPRLWVSYVEAGGPADREGVVPGDELVSIDGRSVAELGPHAAGIMVEGAQVKTGDTVRLELRRDGSGSSVTLEAVARKPPQDAAGKP